MIINVKNKKDLITLDLNLRQLRYLRDYEKRGEILFLDLSNSDVEGYSYLFKEDLKLFKETLKEDLLSFLNINVHLKDLKVLKC